MQDLDDKYKKQLFKVDANYFESFEDRVMQEINKEFASKPVLKWYKHAAVWPVAASIALIAIAFAVYVSTETKTIPLSVEFENLDSAEISRYISSTELTDEEFTALIPDETIDSLYQADIIEVQSMGFNPKELEDLDDEFSILDDTDI